MHFSTNQLTGKTFSIVLSHCLGNQDMANSFEPSGQPPCKKSI